MQIILFAILGPAIAIWIVSVWLTALSFHHTAGPRDSGEDRFGVEPTYAPSQGFVCKGSVDLPGAASEFCDRFVQCLLHPNLVHPSAGTGLGLVRILDRTDDVVRFESNHLGPVGVFDATVRFEAQRPGQTHVTYQIRSAGGSWMLYAAIVVEGLGLVAIVMAWWLIETYVVHNPHPGLRWQTVQAVQVVHFLWPPFLLLALHRRMRTQARARLEVLLANLPYQKFV